MKFQITKSAKWFQDNILEIWDIYYKILEDYGEDAAVYFWADVVDKAKPTRDWVPWYGFRDNFLIAEEGEYVWEGFENWIKKTLEKVGDCMIRLVIEAFLIDELNEFDEFN